MYKSIFAILACLVLASCGSMSMKQVELTEADYYDENGNRYFIPYQEVKLTALKDIYPSYYICVDVMHRNAFEQCESMRRIDAIHAKKAGKTLQSVVAKYEAIYKVPTPEC